VKRALGQIGEVVQASTSDSGIRGRITGLPAIQVEIVDSMRRDVFLFSCLGAALAVGISVVLFRRIAAALLVASGPTVGIIWTVGTLGLIGEPINVLTNIVPVLVLVIGYTDSMHLVLHVRRLLVSGASTREAATSAVRRLGLACALTSLSTAVGFGSLYVASLDGIKTFGWCCALGSVLSFFAVITVVPLLASTPLSRLAVADKPYSAGKLLALPADWILTRILRHCRVVVAGGAVLTVGLAVVAARLEPDYTLSSDIPHSNEAYQALQHVDSTFGGVMFAYVIVEWPEQYSLRSEPFYEVLEEVHAALEASPELSNPMSVLNLVKSLPANGGSLAGRAGQLRYVPEEQLRRFVSSQERRAVVSAHMPDVGARLLKPAFRELERRLDAIMGRHAGFRVELTGSSVAVLNNIHMMIEDLWKSLATAAGVMFLIIWFGLRSLRYALVSFVPNIFPLLCTGAFIVLTGHYLEMCSVIVFSISLGIAVDDTIHFLVRFQQELESDPDPREAVRRAFRVVGLALVMTTVALVAGHGIVMVSEFPMVRLYGMLAAVTIAAALVGDLVILPAILACFIKGRKEPCTAVPDPGKRQPAEGQPAAG
jgi:predicted RND superfamily exporter protein